MRDATREVALWRLLVRVRGLRVRRTLRALAGMRRNERQAAAVVEQQVAALEQHARQRLHVLDFCRRDVRAGAQWHATLRAHDAQLPALRQRRDEAQAAHDAARDEAARALRAWQVERTRADDAKERLRAALAAVAVRGAQS
nr:hypothetical protein HUO10_003584 [Paraburkholderia busanensis]